MHACVDHKSCISDAVEMAESICQEKGLRFTELRRKVLEMVWTSHGPAKAYDILDKLKLENSSAKPPTVYSTLDFLMDNGLIHKLNSLSSYVGCSYPLEHNCCYFLICGKCGEVSECYSSDLVKAINGTVGNSNFTPKNVTLEIEGECQKCNN